MRLVLSMIVGLSILWGFVLYIAIYSIAYIFNMQTMIPSWFSLASIVYSVIGACILLLHSIKVGGKVLVILSNSTDQTENPYKKAFMLYFICWLACLWWYAKRSPK